MASFNVLNYFTTLDDSGPICGPLQNQDCRGADNDTELTRQRDKIIAALYAINADIDAFQITVMLTAIVSLAGFIGLAFVALWLLHRQVNAPLVTFTRAAHQLAAGVDAAGKFDPAPLQPLAARSDEIGAIAAGLLSTAAALEGRQSALAAEAAEIKAKIR